MEIIRISLDMVQTPLLRLLALDRYLCLHLMNIVSKHCNAVYYLVSLSDIIGFGIQEREKPGFHRTFIIGSGFSHSTSNLSLQASINAWPQPCEVAGQIVKANVTSVVVNTGRPETEWHRVVVHPFVSCTAYSWLQWWHPWDRKVTVYGKHMLC